MTQRNLLETVSEKAILEGMSEIQGADIGDLIHMQIRTRLNFCGRRNVQRYGGHRSWFNN